MWKSNCETAQSGGAQYLIGCKIKVSFLWSGGGERKRGGKEKGGGGHITFTAD